MLSLFFLRVPYFSALISQGFFGGLVREGLICDLFLVLNMKTFFFKYHKRTIKYT